ncbi:hypothetical protein [Microcella sp.]|uniref:hypothetical protein n=1 Tax=Microcella sp. TaxID=1913979 RepID=UPI00256B8C9C|nr:hypothetical protein [Microcella sp.]MBX9472161.1 hypothetical protein [Microcella sp.]
MRREAQLWGGAAAAVLGLGAASFALAVVATATPEAHVLRYLEALAADDLVAAARLAGVPDGDALPLGDDGEPSIVRIIERTDSTDGDARVIAEYGTEQDAVTAVFLLTPGPAHLGIVPVWQFARSPIDSASVEVDQHDRLRVNGQIVQTPEAGEAVSLAVFVPSRVTARVVDPHVQADAVSRRVNGSTPTAIVLEAKPTALLTRDVAVEFESFLIACTEQRVLLPTGCPFGRSVTERVVDRPTWQLTSPPDIEIVAGRSPGTWAVVGEAELRLTVQVQRLRDGLVSDLDETVTANLGGEVVITDDGPELTIYPPPG